MRDQLTHEIFNLSIIPFIYSSFFFVLFRKTSFFILLFFSEFIKKKQQEPIFFFTLELWFIYIDYFEEKKTQTLFCTRNSDIRQRTGRRDTERC